MLLEATLKASIFTQQRGSPSTAGVRGSHEDRSWLDFAWFQAAKRMYAHVRAHSHVVELAPGEVCGEIPVPSFVDSVYTDVRKELAQFVGFPDTGT